VNVEPRAEWLGVFVLYKILEFIHK